MDEARILVVDDKGFTRVTLSRYLSQGGHSVTEASSCLEGFQLLSTSGFDLVIVDNSMSEMSGLQFRETACSMKWVNELEFPPKPIFILVSDQIEADLVKSAWEQGFRHVLSKSVDRGRVLEVVKDCLESSQGAGQDEEDEPGRVGKGTPSRRHHLIEFEKSTGQGGLTLYRLSGTLSQGSGFAELVESVVSDGLAKGAKVVFDLGAIDYVNSSGIAGLVQVYKKIAAFGGEVSLVNAQPHVVHVLKNLDLLRFFRYKQNLDAEWEREIESEGTSA